MNDAWATDWLGRLSGNEPTSLMELYAEDARFEDITLRHAVRGRPALRELFGAFMNRAHRHNTWTFISYSGNAYGGAIEWTWTARHRAPFLDLPAEGKPHVHH
jgi:ketosteroid isomerase-like protein